MELVYVLVLEAKFCEFESRHPHQLECYGNVAASENLMEMVKAMVQYSLVPNMSYPLGSPACSPHYGNVAESGLLQQS